MATQGALFFCLLAVASLFVYSVNGDSLSRSDFPKDFIFGAGSSTYQYEGAALEDGRKASIWDTFTHEHPEKIVDHSTGDVADDLSLYKEDVKLMKEIGLVYFRFSISWSRIIPRGKITGGINPLGIKFYNDLINELLANAIKPFVTLFHFDLPQALFDEYGGFLSHKIVEDFKNFADLCFELFGDRVKYWTILNEPNLSTEFGYSSGIIAPGRCSKFMGNCSGGNSATEPYIVGHNLILCHATAIDLYRKVYQLIGTPQFNYIFISHLHAEYSPAPNSVNASYTTDSQAAVAFVDKNGKPLGTPSQDIWLYINPKGLEDLLLYFKRK